jgi:hypothetical protein
MLWADVGWSERLQALTSYHRLLAIPALLVQFRRSEKGWWVLCGFLISATTLLFVSYFLSFMPGLAWRGKAPGVPVHDDIFQGSIFVICFFSTMGVAYDRFRSDQLARSVCWIALAALFLLNFTVSFSSRIALLVAPLLAFFFGWWTFRWKGMWVACLMVVCVSSTFWFLSPSLRERIETSISETIDYFATGKTSSTGLHSAFLRESLTIIASAPIFGHGTGSIPDEFRRLATHETAAIATDNPHNQTFAVAIQIGLVGALVLWSMWIAHLQLFRGKNLLAWFGTVIVIENVISSLVHSHLFDFANGWLYVFGVGVVGGMMSRQDSGANCS